MKRALAAGLLYFLAVFAAGFALGIGRVLWLAPKVGPRAAELLEMPLVLAVMVAAALFLVRRLGVPDRLPARLAMGGAALMLLLLAEWLLVLRVRGLTFEAYAETRDPVAAAAYYAMLGVLAVLPLLVQPLRLRRVAAVVLAVAIAVPTGLAAERYRGDLALSRMIAAVSGELAQTRCGPIEYVSHGNGPAVLLVHGAGGGYDQALDLAYDLADAGFQAVAMSRFGYLGTPLPADASPQAQADAHACLMDALGIRRAAVLGVSAGAPSSLQLALRHPDRVRALALLVPLTYAPREPPRLTLEQMFMYLVALRSDFLFWASVRVAPDLVTRTVLATPVADLDAAALEERARAASLMWSILPVSARRKGLANDQAVAMSLGRYELEKIAAPTLLLSVEDDLYGTWDSARYTAGQIPGARFVGFERGGHVWLGHHAEVLAELKRFFAATS